MQENRKEKIAKIDEKLREEIRHEETREKAPYEVDTGTLSDIATSGGSQEPIGEAFTDDEDKSEADRRSA